MQDELDQIINPQDEAAAKQQLQEAGLQKSVTFTVNYQRDQTQIASFAEYEQKQVENNFKLYYKLKIDGHHDWSFQNFKTAGYPEFFNFGLNTTTWRLLVNKQILMRYERLFIEKQMNEVNTEKKRLETELDTLQREIDRVKEQQRELGDGTGSKSSAGGSSHHHNPSGGSGNGHSGDGHHRSGGGSGYKGNKRPNYGG